MQIFTRKSVICKEKEIPCILVFMDVMWIEGSSCSALIKALKFDAKNRPKSNLVSKSKDEVGRISTAVIVQPGGAITSPGTGR